MPKHRRRKDLTISKWALKAKKVLDVGSEIAYDVIRLRDKPGMVDYASIGTRLLNKVVQKFEGEIYGYFEDWHDISDIAFRDAIMASINKFDAEQVGGHDTYAIMIASVYGEEVGWIRTSATESDGRRNSSVPPQYEGPYIDFDRYEETFNVLGRALWESLDASKVLLTSKTRFRYDSKEVKTKLKPDFELAKDAHASERGRLLYERIKKFLDKGETRSLILLGPPGTGKTTIMKYIASRFDRHTVRVNVSELSNMDSSDLVAAVQLLKPEVLLIDDFDRFSARRDVAILSQLEQVNKAVKLFIVSVNDISDMDPAIIRPQRFDEIVEIKDIDEEVINALLQAKDLPVDFRDTLRGWPVAYIDEFAKRYRVLGPEVALKEVEELRHRVENINNTWYKGLEFGGNGNDVFLDGKHKPVSPGRRRYMADDDEGDGLDEGMLDDLSKEIEMELLE